ncbi:MAG: hypothetical protein J2P36_24240 [Ktedonobacteraceae bacterium]|nr:hypothetical protein [Ktedonobacteraceae bacterium]
MNHLKTITVVLACVSVLVFLLALGAFTAQGVHPDGTRVTFTAQTNPDGKDQSISVGMSPDSGTLTW